MATDNQDKENNTAAPSLSKRGAARRRVTRAGVGAVGVLSTLSAHATLQTTSICNSPSNMAQSLGVVNSHVPAPKCKGLSADKWAGMCTRKSSVTYSRTGVKTTTYKMVANGWPPVCTPETMFAVVFYVNPTGATCPSRTDTNGNTVSTYQAGSYYCATLYDLLKGSQTCDTGKPAPGREFVAAYLNIMSGFIGAGALSLTDLQNIWYELQMSGVYHATGTITWNASAVADYLNKHINVVG